MLVTVAAILGLSGIALWQRGTIATLEADKATLERSLAALELSRDQALVAREVEAARSARAAIAATEARKAVESILTSDFGDCADAPVHPDLLRLIR